MNAALAIQKLIYEQLQQSSEVLSVLGGPHIYDAVPDKKRPPYVLFGTIESDDWSTGTEHGEEHLFELVIWSSSEGRKEIAMISEAVKTTLQALPDIISDHHLVNFTWESSISKRDKDSGYFTAEILFRAVSEPL